MFENYVPEENYILFHGEAPYMNSNTEKDYKQFMPYCYDLTTPI